jgi:serine/threonine-protein kinase HipA
MTNVLEVWLEGRHVGRFAAEGDDSVAFVYDNDAPETPISLSLPRERQATRSAARNFLDNLLPDQAETRSRMATAYGAESTSTLDLLARAGGDVAGGLVLLPEGQDLTNSFLELNPASDREIAERISAIKRDQDAWVPSDRPARFSLAGSQGKFALAKMDGGWYWSNATIPSTHIIKPARPELPGLEQVEAASLNLAETIGLKAPAASVLSVQGHTAYLVERFDRVPGTSVAQRIHGEDFAQAMGASPEAKYGLTAVQAIQMLTTADPTNELSYGFVEQLTFNVLLGNADAHAKNYSLLLRPTGIELAPMYDVVPVGLYPIYDQDLAMRIAGAHRPQAADLSHWRKLARKAHLDEDRVADLVTGVAERLAEHNGSAWELLDEVQAEAMRATVERNTDKTLAPDSETNLLS